MTKIRIGHMRRDHGEYVGRGTPLGNEERLKNRSKRERDRVCDVYDIWFADKVRENDQRVMAELNRLLELYREHGELILLCWCEPKRCHAETIKRWLEKQIRERSW